MVSGCLGCLLGAGVGGVTGSHLELRLGFDQQKISEFFKSTNHLEIGSTPF